MKVNIYETVMVSDEQRVQLAVVLDGKVKPKRQATREEIKDYIWDKGRDWAVVLLDDYRESTGDGTPTQAPDEDDEDLVGDQPEATDDENLI